MPRILMLSALSLITAPVVDAQQRTNWSTNATGVRGQNGAQFTYVCPPASSARPVWGTDIYSDDSSICTAAVHAGVITLSGGMVVIEIRPGQSRYAGTTRHGVQSGDWGVWAGSFVVVSGGGTGDVSLSWSDNAVSRRGRNGERFTAVCPPNGRPRSVWGTDVYSDDSSICTAAVHAGAITLAEGGRVTIEIRPGQSAYPPSTRNGITSARWGAWNGSFAILN